MNTGVIRPARAEDLPQVYNIWYEAEVGDEPNPPPRRGVPPFFQQELRTGEMYVVERDSQVVTFATLITRDGKSYLAEFFVRKAHQSTHIGTRLLSQVLPRDGRPCCTLSSRDPREAGRSELAKLGCWAEDPA